MKKKELLIPFLSSVLVYLLTCWNICFSTYSALWAESVSFFVLTYYMLDNFAEKGSWGLNIILMIILGRIILEIPIRIDNFSGTIASLYITIVVLITILLSAVFWRERKPSVLVLSIGILMLLNTLGYDGWIKYII